VGRIRTSLIDTVRGRLMQKEMIPAISSAGIDS
jgi:hypothetical protein